MNILKPADFQQATFEKQVDNAGYKMYSEFLNFLHQ